MNRTGLPGRELSLLACLLLTVCASGNVRDGDLSENGKERSGDLYVELALEYLRQEQTETALQKVADALATDPDNPQAHNLIRVIPFII